jgi:hypothetical protein
MTRTSRLPVSLWTSVAVATFLALLARTAGATPSTVFWAPSTPFVQPFGVLHLTYDTYFGTRAEYPTDAGLTMGILPWKGFQSEVGFDLFYPSVDANGPIDVPLVLNAKVGAPEDVYFKGQPAWSFGIYGVGLEADYNDQNVLYANVGKTVPHIGAVSIGGYYGLNEDLFLSSTGQSERSGLLASWQSPSIDLPRIDKIVLAWDIQTGKNVLGATGGGAYVYFTPAIDLIIGPVFYFDEALQPGGSSWLWTMQLDVDLSFRSDNAK